jgi:hypothetical protein
MSPRVRRLTISVVGLFGTLLLIGCNAPGVSVSVAPPSAQTILQNAQKAPFHDATLTIRVTGATVSLPAPAAGKPVVIPYVVTGTGKFTTHPERYYERLTWTYSSQFQQTTTEEIIDVATDIAYTKTTRSGSKWVLNSGSSSGWVDISLVPRYIKNQSLQNVVLVGSDTIAGTAVWHIKLTLTHTACLPGTEDLYVTKDTYLAKKVVYTCTGPLSVTITELFTAYNTGITIDLPPTWTN